MRFSSGINRLLHLGRWPVSYSEWVRCSVFINRSPHVGVSGQNITTGKCSALGRDYKAAGTGLPGQASGALRASPMFLKPQVVVYDGVCHLCNSGVRWLIKADKHKRLSFCAVQSELAAPYLLVCSLSRKDVLNRFLFVEGPGQFSQASTAALRVALYLPLPYPVLAILLIVPTPLRDSIYDYVAQRRYKWFGRSTECILPSDDILDRFIDREELVEKLAKQEQKQK